MNAAGPGAMVVEPQIDVTVKEILSGMLVAMMALTWYTSRPRVAKRMLHSWLRPRLRFQEPSEVDLNRFRMIDLSTAGFMAAYGLLALWTDGLLPLVFIPIAALAGWIAGAIAANIAYPKGGQSSK